MYSKSHTSGIATTRPIPRASIFLVASDMRLPSGQMLRDVPCSRSIHRIGILRRVLKRFQRHNPKAFAVERTFFR